MIQSSDASADMRVLAALLPEMISINIPMKSPDYHLSVKICPFRIITTFLNSGGSYFHSTEKSAKTA